MSTTTTTELTAVARSPSLPTFFDNLDSFAEAPQGVAKLRELILELAYTGKLAGGSQSDEWQTKTVEEASTIVQPGAACGKQHQVSDGYVHLRTHNIATNGKLNFDLIIRVDPAKIDKKKAHLRKGDIIFNNTNSQELVGKTCLVDQDYDYAYSNHLTLVRLTDDIDPAFVVGYFRLLLRRSFFFQLCNRWIGQAGINTKVLKEIVIPFPPLAEQRRIVSKVDALMSLCDELESLHSERGRLREHASRSLLDRLVSSRSRRDLSSAWQRLSDHFEMLYDTPETLAHLRQSILQLAVQGKLVPQDPNDEPANVLVEKIASETARLVKNKEIRNPQSLLPLEPHELPFDLPVGWKWIQAQDACKPSSLITYGVLKPVWVDEGVPTVRVKDMKNGGIVTNAVAHCSPERAEKFSKTTLSTGDLLIAKDGATLGKTGFVPASLDGGNVTQHVLRFPVSRHLSRLYIRLVVDAPHGQAWMTGETKGVALPGVNVGDFRRMPIPLPPLAEQKRIVAKVDQLLSQCDELSARLRDRLSATEQLLTASIHRIVKQP